MRKTAVILIGVLLIFVLAACDGTDISKSAYISEIMSQNTKTLADENGDYCDWIEINNPTEQDINLAGYVIADNSGNSYTFPELTLKAGKQLVVFANGVEKYDVQRKVIHVPLSVGAKGENIYLYNEKGALVCRISVPGLETDKSFGVDSDGRLAIFDNPTPGKPNSVETQQSDNEEALTVGGLYINEYSPNSARTFMDEDGEYVAWVELYNSTDADINLKDFCLTDDALDKTKWVFPDYTIRAGEYGLVYLSGKNKAYEGGKTVHATFKLNGKEEELYLVSKTGVVVDKCPVYELVSNLSCGRVETEKGSVFAFFAKATPGVKNDSTYFDSVDSARYIKNKSIAITEVAAVNTSKASADGEYYDYIELYNNSSKKINLGNYKLSDSKKAESFKQLPERWLEPGKYAVICCGSEDYTDSSGSIHVDFGLNRYGETIYLSDKNGVLVDEFSYGRLADGISSGREEDGTAVYYTSFTPGEKNPSKVYKSALANPVFSQSSTYVEKGAKIEITVPHGEIRYTLDGSEPEKSSALYKKPLKITKTTVVRAKCFEDGYIPSDTICATYLVQERRHDLPVVFLTTDEKNLYDNDIGIWAKGSGASEEYPYEGANFWQDWEREINFEYMTADGVSQLSFDAGMSVFGQFSRANDQKSVEIKLKDKYGPSEICYPFFENNGVNVFSSFILRNSGQDYNSAHIRDAFAAMVIKNQMDIDIMDYKPVVCYVNGKYHGIYDLREKIDDSYLANHHGVDPDNVDIIKANSDVKKGTFDNYESLLNFLNNSDLSVEANYKKACELIDIDELINYWMCESFFTNTDTGNIKFWRENKEGAKWRWIFFDVDWSLFSTTYDYNIIDNYLDPEGHGVNQAFSTDLFIALYKNASFRTRMLEIFSQHLKTTFREERMLEILDELIEEIDSEMPYYLERWNVGSYDSWKSSVSSLREIIKEKIKMFPDQMKEGLSMTDEEVKKYLS